MKRWFIKVIFFLCLFLTTVSIITITVDPFFHYHKPLDNLYTYYSREPYQNPGILQNYDYETLILGSCMAENFVPSLFDAYTGGKTIKTPHQAASLANLCQYADIAVRKNKELKTIYWGIDIWTLDAYKVDYIHDPVPEWLVDDNIFTDIHYLFNEDVLFLYDMRVLGVTLFADGIVPSENMDYAYSWRDIFTFSQQGTLAAGGDINASLHNSIEERRQNFEDNLNNVTRIIESNPDVEFVFFYPPYSLLFWKENDENQILKERLDREKELTEKLLGYENVKVYSFQNDEDIISNLYLYKDLAHYSGYVNDYMVDFFFSDTYQLTLDNYEEEINSLSDLVKNFDYQRYENELITCTNVDEYWDLCQNEDYLTFILLDAQDCAAGEWIINAVPFIGSDINGNGKNVIIMDGKEMVSAEEVVEKNVLYNGIELGFNTNTNAWIYINGINYGYSNRGVNIVVWDKAEGCTLDSINIDVMDGKITHY